MEPAETPSTSWTGSPPLDPRVLANVVRSYEGETLQVPECDVPVYHGKGRLEFKTGFSYVGDFVCGRMHGTGRIEWQTSGVMYEGDFTNSEITGRGTYWWPNGSSYAGDVKGGKRHGRGVFITGDRGVMLDEQSKNDDREDVEVEEPTIPKPLLFAFRSMEGQTQLTNHDPKAADIGGNDENMDGEGSNHFGIVVAQRNARYDGEWENGLPHGYGELVFDAARNIRYEGHFVTGKREGKGHMHYADGSVYTGDWKDDAKCGQGIMTWMAAGESSNLEDATPLERYDGEWENDCQQGFGRHVWLMSPNNIPAPGAISTSSTPHDKNWYEGEFHDGLRHGRGVFFYANGARYEGEWKANVKDGYGLFFYEDGRVFVGLFRQDRSVEGCYVTAAMTAGVMTPISTALPVVSPQQTESSIPASAVSPLQVPSSSSSVAGIMLFINDIMAMPDSTRCEKARKAVEHAALRINTELRALYRVCIRESRRSSANASVDPEDTGTLLEVFECRQLLSQCGFYFTSGQLEAFMQDVRKAQRASALACASSMNIAEHFSVNLPAENCARNSVDPSRLEIVLWDQLLLYREFVELLVRIAHSWVTTAETDGVIDFSVSRDSTVFLADIFSDMYEQMMRERHEALSQAAPSWIALLRTELMGKKLHSVFNKHHDHLRSLYCSCAVSSVMRQDEDTEGQAHDNEEPHLPTADDNKQVETVSIRSVLVMLRNDAATTLPIFTADFQIRDALAALNRAFTASSPPLKAELLHNAVTGERKSNRDAEPDAFFMGIELVFSEFLDAIAIVLFTKQQMALEASTREPSMQQKHSQELPLHVLVDQFIQTVKVTAQPLV